MKPFEPIAPHPPATVSSLYSRSQRRIVLVAAILASSLGFIDGSVVAIALPAIRADLSATLADAQWISNGYMLFLSSLVLLGGAAGDVYGARRVFMAGIALFVATSLVCALAPDAPTLIVMRAAQGFGAALMVPGSLAMIARAYPLTERGQAIGIWAAASSLTTALGPTLGGLLLSFGDEWAWRLIFAINAPIGLLAFFLLWRRVPAAGMRGSRRLDIPGAVLATTGLGFVAWGLTALGLEAGERLASPAFLLAGGGVLLGAFLWWESRAADPMIRLSLFANRAFFGANLYTLLLFLGFNAILFFLPMTVIAGWGRPEWQASLLFAPLSVFIGVLSAPVGRLADRIGARSLLTAGACILACCYAALALTMPLMDLWRVTMPILLFNGLGMALLVSPLSAAVMTAAPDQDSGAASGINNAVARSAGLIAVATFGATAGTIFNSRIVGVPGLETSGFGATLEGAVEAGAVQRFSEATNSAFSAIAYSAAVLCLLAAGVAWLTQPRRTTL